MIWVQIKQHSLLSTKEQVEVLVDRMGISVADVAECCVCVRVHMCLCVCVCERELPLRVRNQISRKWTPGKSRAILSIAS